MQPSDTKQKLTIFDTTLRDGEQGAGTKMTGNGKIQIARLLDQIGVDVIEAGFPVSSNGEHDTVKTIAGLTSKAQICALARGRKEDIDAAVSALKPAGDRARVHVFTATDKNHMAVKLRQTTDQVLASIYESVMYASQYIKCVQFSPEVATTTDTSFLFEAVKVAIEAGATTINIPDTNGCAMVREYGELISSVVDYVESNHQGVVVSVHCHDDHGLATANTLQGVLSGARQVECTVNGIGERAGNTSLEEVLMAVSLRPEIFGVKHSVDTTKLVELSDLVSRVSGVLVQPNKAFVGANAFAHQSGIHQDGVLKDPRLYEICDPELVGATRRLPIGKLSGKAGLTAAITNLGFYNPTKTQVEKIYDLVMRQADEHGSLTEGELQKLVSQVVKISVV